MSRKRLYSDHVRSIRIGQSIRSDIYPEIADLYKENCSSFSIIVREALILYAYARQKAGATSLSAAIGLIHAPRASEFHTSKPLYQGGGEQTEQSSGSKLENNEPLPASSNVRLTEGAAEAFSMLEKEM